MNEKFRYVLEINVYFNTLKKYRVIYPFFESNNIEYPFYIWNINLTSNISSKDCSQMKVFTLSYAINFIARSKHGQMDRQNLCTINKLNNIWKNVVSRSYCFPLCMHANIHPYVHRIKYVDFKQIFVNIFNTTFTLIIRQQVTN